MPTSLLWGTSNWVNWNVQWSYHPNFMFILYLFWGEKLTYSKDLLTIFCSLGIFLFIT